MIDPDRRHDDLTELSNEVGAWSEENFGDADDIVESLSSRPDPGADVGTMFTAMGAAEEVGELLHSVLKRGQGIRLDEADVGAEAEKDAVGDVVIYLADFCHRRGYDLGGCVEEAWDGEVSDREWDSATRSDGGEQS